MTHDKRYKFLFSHPEFVQELFVGFLPEPLKDTVVFETLERVNASFVSEQLKHREGDIIWKVQLKGGDTLYLYLLLEFQSSDDKRMPLRMLQYVISLYDHLIREKQVSLDYGLPPVLPVVLYNGERPWQTPVAIEQIIRYPAFLARWQPKMEYLLLDEGRLDKQQLSEQELFIAAIFELDAPGPVEDVVAVAQRLSALWRKHPLAPELAEAIKDWFCDALLVQGVDKTQIEQLLEGEITMFGEKFIRWQEQTLQKGMEKGMEKGREQALQEAAINLYRNGLEPAFIATSLNISLEKIKQWIKGVEH